MDDSLDEIVAERYTPEFSRQVDRLLARKHRIDRLTLWMRRIPVLGDLTYTFWSTLLDEGVRETCKPRWGALTFCYLNDGIRPTLWHTWRSLTHDQDDPFTGIYTDGAPRSYAEALERERIYKQRNDGGSIDG